MFDWLSSQVRNESRDSLMNIHQTKKSTWRFIYNFQWNLLRIIDPQKYKQMAEFDDFNFDTSSNEGEFEGCTPDDVIKAIEKLRRGHN